MLSKMFCLRIFYLLKNDFLENWFAPKIFIKYFLEENFLLLKNNFLEYRFAPKRFNKNFSVDIFHCWKIISSKTYLNQKFLVEIFMAAKWFPWKQVCTKHFHETILAENVYGCKNISSKTKRFIKNFWSKMLWFQNHFLEYRFPPKILIKIFFWSKIFMAAKSFPRKHVAPKIFIKNFLVAAF